MLLGALRVSSHMLRSEKKNNFNENSQSWGSLAKPLDRLCSMRRSSIQNSAYGTLAHATQANGQMASFAAGLGFAFLVHLGKGHRSGPRACRDRVVDAGA